MFQHTIRLFQVADLAAHKRVWIESEWAIYDQLIWRMLDQLADDIICGKLQDGCYPIWQNGNCISAYIATFPDSTEVTLIAVVFSDDGDDDPNGGLAKIAYDGAEAIAEFALDNDGRSWSLVQSEGDAIERPTREPGSTCQNPGKVITGAITPSMFDSEEGGPNQLVMSLFLESNLIDVELKTIKIMPETMLQIFHPPYVSNALVAAVNEDCRNRPGLSLASLPTRRATACSSMWNPAIAPFRAPDFPGLARSSNIILKTRLNRE